MTEITNIDVLGGVLQALHEVAGRRTTNSFAIAVIGAIIKTLEQNYEFLKYIQLKDDELSGSNDFFEIHEALNSVDTKEIGKSIEGIIRVVYMDLIGKAGLFFIKELKEAAGEQVVSQLKQYNVDFSSLQIEQRFLYRQRQKKEKNAKRREKGKRYQDGVSLLGYTWKSVSSWELDPSKKICTLYDTDGKVLDQLNFDNIIESYVKGITNSYDEIPEEFEEIDDTILDQKEFELLQMLNKRDMDAETAITLLHITTNEFQTIIQKLLQMGMLHYVSFNEIELTEQGINYLAKRSTKKVVTT